MHSKSLRPPAWSPAGFLNRVRMSRFAQLFLVVEGKSTDKWFYEELLKQSETTKGQRSEIYPVEYVSRGLDDSDAGGKSRVLALHRELASQDGLVIYSNGNRRVIVFCIDSDHDHVIEAEKVDNHIVYTELPDAEAHLIDALDLVELGRRMLSASTVEASAYSRHLEGWREDLAQSWREWFVLCLAAYYAGHSRPTPGTRAPRGSKEDMRVVDAKAIDDLSKLFSAGTINRARERAEERIAQYFDSDNEVRLLKGKWLITYLKERSNTFARMTGLQTIRSDEAVREAVKGSCIFSDPWADYFLLRFEAALRGDNELNSRLTS